MAGLGARVGRVRILTEKRSGTDPRPKEKTQLLGGLQGNIPGKAKSTDMREAPRYFERGKGGKDDGERSKQDSLKLAS